MSFCLKFFFLFYEKNFWFQNIFSLKKFQNLLRIKVKNLILRNFFFKKNKMKCKGKDFENKKKKKNLFD